MRRSGQKTVGFYSPMPPSPTGVADYSAALLEALRKFHSRFEDGHETAIELDANAPDVALYHIGNNQLHRAIYDRAIAFPGGAVPGVAVLHDAVLQHFFLGTLDESRYCEEFIYNYGEWMRGLAEDLWRNRARSAADPRYFDYPMLKRIAESSRAIIVHNPAAARVVNRHAPNVRIVEIPHLFAPPGVPDESGTLRLRTELGLGPGTLLAGVFGHLRESKRLPVVMRAFHRAVQAGADARLLVAGAFVSRDLERALAPLLGDARIIRVGHLSEEDFWRYAAATDVCINLRFPTAAESSGIAIRMMGIGKPVIFTAGEEIARIPENACLRIEMGPLEEEMLAGYIVWLASEREAARQIGCRAAAHVAKYHATEVIAKAYWDVLNSVLDERKARP